MNDIDFFKDENFEESTSSIDLGYLGKLLRERLDLQKEIEQQEEKLKQLNAKFLVLNEKTIPDVMAEYGLSQITTDEGLKVTVKRYTKASIPVANRQEALQWLEDQGYGDLIKHNIQVRFGKGESEDANQLKQLLEMGHYRFDEKMDVHPQTLNAFIDELLSHGITPPDCFTVFLGNKTVVK